MALAPHAGPPVDPLFSAKKDDLDGNATVVVQTSLAEGFGLTATEPMWKGTPVVASLANGRKALVVRHCDAAVWRAMPTMTTYDDLLARVRGLIATTDRIPVVGLTGHGGSGKSTLATRLGADLGLEPDQVVPADCFYATTCGPDAGMWEQHDWPLIEALVTGVRRDPPPKRLRFDYRWWTGETGVEDHPMPPVLIVEGIRLINDRTRVWFDLTVWIDLDAGTAGRRAKARNLLQGDAQGELDLWDTKWIPEGHHYECLERPRERADLVLTPTS